MSDNSDKKYTIEDNGISNKYEIAKALDRDGDVTENHSVLLSDESEINGSLTVESDENYYKEIKALYANVLNANGSNLLDPYKAYLTHFNRLQRIYADPASNGKTYIFMTRPDLNFFSSVLGMQNVESVSLFNYYSKTNMGLSIMPWLMFPNRMKMEFSTTNQVYRAVRNRIGITQLFQENLIRTPYSNNFTPFIPLISNLCKSSSGGNQLSIDTEVTDGDLQGNKLQYAKGADSSFAPGEITLEFDDLYGNPLMHLINFWIHYIHYLTKGIVKSWEPYIMYKILDYTCSIYIFETEKDNSTITRFVKYTGCFPRSIDLASIQHNAEGSIDAARHLSIPFAYNRCEPMDPHVIADFNFLMNKFIMEEDNVAMKWMYGMGEAPRKLITPDAGYNPVDVINQDTGIVAPYHVEYTKDGERTYVKDFISNTSDYYDRKNWGVVPYIYDHKLIWIPVNQVYNDNMNNRERGKSIDEKIASNIESWSNSFSDDSGTFNAIS